MAEPFGAAEKQRQNPLDDLPKTLPDVPREKILLTYQQWAVVLIDNNNFSVIDKSRRIGLTWGIASYATLKAASQGRSGMNVYYMGYNLDMARDFILVCGEFAKAYGYAIEQMGEVVIKDEDGDILAHRIRFASGYEILALPSAARVLRGKQGMVIIDEAAFHKEMSEVLKAALPLLMWGGKVVVVSTHNGVDNPFNELIAQVKSGERSGGHMTITFDEAVKEGLHRRIMDVTKQDIPEDEWITSVRSSFSENEAAEELDCIPSSGAGSWLSPGDIAAAEHPDTADPKQYEGGPVYIGWDIARREDLSVAWAFERINETLWLRERIEMRKTKFAVQYDKVSDAVRGYRTIRLALDQTGMGEAVTEEMINRHGSLAEGVILSGPKRLELGTYIKDRFERGLIRIPADPEVRKDLRAIKKTTGATGAPRLVEDGDVHPDIFWAIALACGAAAEPHQPFDYTQVMSGRGDPTIWGPTVPRVAGRKHRNDPLAKYRKSSRGL